jgi:hypothetical protein
MNEVIAQIVQISVVNSGMFDLLTLNTDVESPHLVGENNVGKTSLIEMIQFLYFRNINDIHFSKTSQESLRFYFRREGSYILFSVRTLKGTTRTIGIYGQGDADSRKYFVYDGLANTADYLDAAQKVLPFTTISGLLAGRNFYLFTTNADYDKAIIGQHAHSSANVHIFDIDNSQLRLLRNLLKNLLQLNRLTDNDIRLFLNNEAEMHQLPISIDMSQTYKEKYAMILEHKKRITDLQTIAPFMQEWHDALATLSEQNDRLVTFQGRLAHALTRQQQLISDQHATCTAQIAAVEQQRDANDTQRATLNTQQGELNNVRNQYATQLKNLQALAATCAGHDKIPLTQQSDALYAQIHSRQQTLQSGDSPALIMRKINEATQRLQQLRHQHAGQTILQRVVVPYADANVRAVVNYLLSADLLSLPITTHLSDEAAFQRFLHEIQHQIDDHGTFRGFGLHIPRTQWQQATVDDVPLAEQIAELNRRITELQHAHAVASNQAQTQHEITTMQSERARITTLLNALEKYEELHQQTGGVGQLHASIAQCAAQLTAITTELTTLVHAVQQLNAQRDTLRNHQNSLTQRLANLVQRLTSLAGSSEPIPPDIMTIDEALLADFINDTESTLMKCIARVDTATRQRDRATQVLERIYERNSTAPFATWVQTQQELVVQIPKIEQQLGEQYRDMILFVNGNLENLKKTFDHITNTIQTLNNNMSDVSISNIKHISITLKSTALLDAISKMVVSMRASINMFDVSYDQSELTTATEEVHRYITEQLQNYGTQIRIDSMFDVEFTVTYLDGSVKPTKSIHAFESNGTVIGIKIVLYLGLIRLLLKPNRRHTTTRIPFFLDEVGSLSTNNVRSIVEYCNKHHFLPLFASPSPRVDVSHNYILQRRGQRSVLTNVIIATPAPATDTP